MPVNFTPEELVTVYEQRVDQLRREWLGNDLRLAEVKADPKITNDDEKAAVKEIQENLHVIEVAYDAAEAKLEEAKAQLPEPSPDE